MATTDANGILFYETTDAVSPLQVLLNSGQTSVSNAIGQRGKMTKSAAASPPSGSVNGDLWFQTDTKAWGIHDGAAWIITDTVWQAWTPTVMFIGNAGNVVIGNGALDGQYFRRGKQLDIQFRLYKGTTTAYGTTTGTMILRPPSGMTFSSSNSWGSTTAIDGMYSGFGKAWNQAASVQTMAVPMQYGGDANAMYFQAVSVSSGGSPVPGSMLTQDVIGSSAVGVGAGSYFTMSVSGVRIQ